MVGELSSSVGPCQGGWSRTQGSTTGSNASSWLSGRCLASSLDSSIGGAPPQAKFICWFGRVRSCNALSFKVSLQRTAVEAFTAAGINLAILSDEHVVASGLFASRSERTSGNRLYDINAPLDRSHGASSVTSQFQFLLDPVTISFVAEESSQYTK